MQLNTSTNSTSAVSYKSISVFQGLNALRFFAAFLVVIHHAETIRKKNGLFNFEFFSLFKNGGHAVNFFFVLSGFLITYLLLKESDRTQTISVKNFYLKRVLRIWPLYFLMVALGTIILPFVFPLLHIDYVFPYTFGQSWYYFLFFVPALITYFFGTHLLQPLWSIGVEEVFYLMWAPLVKAFRKNILPILFSIFILKVILNILVFPLGEKNIIYYMVNLCLTFEDMAVGGLGAYFLFHSNRSITNLWIYKLPVQIICYGLLSTFLLFDQNISNPIWHFFFGTPILYRIVLDLFFLYLIVGVSLNEKNIFKLRSKRLSYLGEISYGIYMYHMLIVFGLVLLLKNWLLGLNGYIASLIFFSILTVGVISVSALSKRFMEDYFLKLKSKLK